MHIYLIIIAINSRYTRCTLQKQHEKHTINDLLM